MVTDGKDCPLCSAGEVGRRDCRDIVMGRKTVFDVSIFYKTTPEVIMEHLDNHEIVKDSDGNFNSPDFYMQELLTQLRYLKSWLKYSTTANGSMSREDVELAIKLSREIRATVESLGTFQGRLSSSPQITVNIDQINQRYMAITNLLMTDTCDNCRSKVLTLMDTIEVIPKQIGDSK